MKYYLTVFLILTTFFYLIFHSKLKNHLENKLLEKESDDLFYPADFEMIKRTFPFYNYDQNIYAEAISQLKIEKESQKLNKNNNLESLQWDFVGPTNIAGRVVDIEFNPKNPNIVYAVAATGGVFKSEDMGNNWYPIFDEQPCLSIGDIGIDPNHPDTIYVGTGEANGGHNNFPGIGIFKSTDAGNTWTFIGLDSSVSIGRIIIDPNNSKKIIVAAVGSYFIPNSQRGVFISEDAGKTWKKSLFISDSTGAIDLAINPNNSNEIFAAMWERVRRPELIRQTHLYGPTSGIYKTINGGENWIKLDSSNGLPFGDSLQIGRIGLAISESSPNIIYSTFSDGDFLTGLYKSEDSGHHWIKINTDFPGSGNFSWYFGQVRVDPEIPEDIFVLDVSLLKSSSSGQSWDFSYGYNGPNQFHVDHHALAFNPKDPDYILDGNDGGINISSDGGATWSNPIALPITQFYEIGLDKNNPQSYYGGTQDNSVIRTLTGNNFDWNKIYGGDGFYVIVDPNDPKTIFAESQFGDLSKSTDGGSNFNSCLNGINMNEPKNWSTPVVMDPNNSSVLYFGTHTIYRTENSAELWQAVSPKLTDYTVDKKIGTITTIAVARSNSDVIYIGTDDGNVWVTKNYGASWEKISKLLPVRWVTRVVIDPQQDSVVYVTFSGLKWAETQPHVFRSDNFGKTWNEINSGLPDAPVNAFAVDNNNTNILYLGNDVGAFISYDKGANWQILGENLPIVVVNDMKIHPFENYLAIGTHGRGMYKMDLNQITNASEQKNKIAGSYELFQNYPNPFNNSTTIKFTVPNVEMQNYGSLRLIIYDVLGREINTLVNEEKSPGNYTVYFDASKLSSGIYYYSLISKNIKITKKMVFLK